MFPQRQRVRIPCDSQCVFAFLFVVLRRMHTRDRYSSLPRVVACCPILILHNVWLGCGGGRDIGGSSPPIFPPEPGIFIPQNSLVAVDPQSHCMIPLVQAPPRCAPSFCTSGVVGDVFCPVVSPPCLSIAILGRRLFWPIEHLLPSKLA